MARVFKLFVILVSVVLAAGLISAQDIEPGQEKEKEKEKKETHYAAAEPIVVTATKTEISEKETGASITVITEKEIQDKQNNSMTDILRSVPGVTISAGSHFGGVTSIFIRGANSGNSIVLIDGVRINDPTSPNKLANIGFLLTDNVGKIEVIRGSQSTLYGSDAMGGVINIITKKGTGGPTVSLYGEGGAYDTLKAAASVSGGSDKAYYSVSLSRDMSAGINATAVGMAVPPLDRDGYTNTTASARFGLQLFHQSWLTLSAWYVNQWNAIDDFAYQDDPNRTFTQEQFSGILTYALPVFSFWETKLIAAYLDLVKRDYDPANNYSLVPDEYSDYRYHGHYKRFEWRNRFTIGSVDEILLGAEVEGESLSNSSHDLFMGVSYLNRRTYTNAAFIQNHLKLFDRIFIVAGMRYTMPDNFASVLCYSVSGSFIIPYLETRIKGNYSTGFKTPTLFQRYSPYGSYALRPERSVSYDIGIEQPIFGEVLVAQVNWFSIRYENQIGFLSGRYTNLGTDSTARGVESIVRLCPVDKLTMALSYTYTFSRDQSTGRQLLWRPHHQGYAALNYNLLDRVNINGSLLYTGSRLDSVYIPFIFANANRYLHAYFRLDAAITFRVMASLQIYIRGENLLNAKYEEVSGYRTPGLSLYGGFKATL